MTDEISSNVCVSYKDEFRYRIWWNVLDCKSRIHFDHSSIPSTALIVEPSAPLHSSSENMGLGRNKAPVQLFTGLCILLRLCSAPLVSCKRTDTHPSIPVNLLPSWSVHNPLLHNSGMARLKWARYPPLAPPPAKFFTFPLWNRNTDACLNVL